MILSREVIASTSSSSRSSSSEVAVPLMSSLAFVEFALSTRARPFPASEWSTRCDIESQGVLTFPLLDSRTRDLAALSMRLHGCGALYWTRRQSQRRSPSRAHSNKHTYLASFLEYASRVWSPRVFLRGCLKLLPLLIRTRRPPPLLLHLLSPTHSSTSWDAVCSPSLVLQQLATVRV